VILPNLLRETGQRDLIISDLKLELLGKTYRYLARHYDVWVLNFGSPATSLGYNPFSCCTSPHLTALWCNAWIRNTGANEKEPIWDNWTRDGMMASIFHMEQDHRGLKQRYYPMRGCGSFDAAAHFCSAHDELRDHLRYRHHLNETVSLADQRRLFAERWGEVCAVLQAA